MQAVTSNESELQKEFHDYVYGVSHDVSAPARSMIEFSRLLTQEHADALNDEGKLYLSLIIESGEKLQKMMIGLLNYSRLNTEARPFAKIDCNVALRNALASLGDSRWPTGAGIDSVSLPELDADARQIEQLFAILIDNALKFQPRSGKPQVNIGAEKRGDRWIFSVADNGVGVDPRHKEKIFQLFQRLHTDQEYPGVGMGLALARKIVRRHGGEIWCESELGRGATFFFALPEKND